MKPLVDDLINKFEEELNKEKNLKIERRGKTHLSVRFKKFSKNIKNQKSKFPTKKKSTKNKKNNTSENNKVKQDRNDYSNFFDFLKEGNDSKDQKVITEPKKAEFTKPPIRKSMRRFTKILGESKKPNFLKQKTFKNFKEESFDEEDLIDYKKFYNEEKKLFKKKNNLNKFKNQISKMRDMSIDDYMNYIEHYFSPLDKNENFNNNDKQDRINMFLDCMRKNIEKFKGRQNILTVNCVPIDYIITIGNGLGNSYNDNKENKENDNSKNETKEDLNI